MRAPLSWLVELVPALADHSPQQVSDLLTGAGLEVDEIEGLSTDDVNGLVIGEVLEIEELTEFKKPIRYCQVRVSDELTRGIVCGATNFAVGDRVVVAQPGAVLPGDFRIAARKTYGHVSEGMMCSARELGLGEEHDGILILAPDAPIGTDPADLLGLHEVVLVTEPTPDRGYQLSMRGIARELAAVLREQYSDPAFSSVEPVTEGGFPVELADPVGCDRFSTAILRGFNPLAPSPEWMRKRLVQGGMRPISLAVDVTNYVNLLLGQPMHAYDLHKLAGRIVVRRAAEGETLTTLDDVTRTLRTDDLLITDGEQIQGLAGIMGGAASEISDQTVDILLEAAHFDPVTISRSARKHALLSEAGRRFERGVDPALGPVAIDLAARLLCEYGGATVDGPVGTVGVPAAPAPVSVPAAAIRSLVGVDYDIEVITDTLQRVGCTVVAGEPLVITPPSWRADLLEAADFAEEVARLDGYDKIPVVLPHAQAGRGLSPAQRRRRQVSRALAYAGYVETPSLSFHDTAVLDALRIPEQDLRRALVAMANPLSSDQTHLRSSLLPNLLRTLGRNVGKGFEDVAVTEIGTVFRERSVGAVRPPAPILPGDVRPSQEQLDALDAALPIETTNVAVAITGQSRRAGWWGTGERAGWADAVEAARLVADSVGVRVHLSAANVAPWHPGRCAAVALPDGTVIGHAGELHPAVCEALEIPRRTSAMELDLTAAIAAAEPVNEAPQVSAFPAAVQDIALVVGDDVPARTVELALWSGGGELLEDVRLFDVYAGEQVGADRKSLAYRLRFRAPDRTLTNEEVATARSAAVDSAVDSVGATLRG